MAEVLFKVCDIVTLKTHPLKESFRIKGDAKTVPPLMMIKEVHIEDEKKKIYNEQLGVSISDKHKYLCVYFDDNKMEFKELFVYHSMLISFDKLKYEKISKDTKPHDKRKTLIEEVKEYTTPKYKFGEMLYFRTIKLEAYKKKSSKKINHQKGKKDELENTITENIKESLQYLACYTSPSFIISGLKLNDDENTFFNDGKPRKTVSEKLVKVLWFNSIQQKNSEKYLPLDFFIDKNPFDK